MHAFHTIVWIMQMFGLFFILGAHEHYSIDVFVAFYISSRLFMYYHSLSNNRVLFQNDHKRVKTWFPMFSYFEGNLHSRVPNEFQNPLKILKNKLFKKYKNGNGGSAANHSNVNGIAASFINNSNASNSTNKNSKYKKNN
jgi:hypothetical protein